MAERERINDERQRKSGSLHAKALERELREREEAVLERGGWLEAREREVAKVWTSVVMELGFPLGLRRRQ